MAVMGDFGLTLKYVQANLVNSLCTMKHFIQGGYTRHLEGNRGYLE